MREARDAYEVRERASAVKQEKLDALVKSQDAAIAALKVAEEKTKASHEAQLASKRSYDHARSVLRDGSPTALVSAYEKNCVLQAEVAFLKEDCSRLSELLDSAKVPSDN